MIDPDRFEEMRSRLQNRVKQSRYLHSMGVSQTAEQLARVYGVNENDAAVAGLLHDWDKALSASELRNIAKRLKLASRDVRRQMPGVLHALTAPHSLRKEFPELSDEVLQAVEHHTCGARDMADLDKIVFIADIIEPGRTFADVGPLRDAVGKVSLDELFFVTYGSTLVYLIRDGLPVHPDSLGVWNDLVAQREKRRIERERLAACGETRLSGGAGQDDQSDFLTDAAWAGIATSGYRAQEGSVEFPYASVSSRREHAAGLASRLASRVGVKIGKRRGPSYTVIEEE